MIPIDRLVTVFQYQHSKFRRVSASVSSPQL